MENLFVIYGVAAAIALGVFAFRALRSDETSARRLAKIRVPVDDSRRKRIEEPADEEYDSSIPLAWLAFGMSVIFILVLFQAF